MVSNNLTCVGKYEGSFSLRRLPIQLILRYIFNQGFQGTCFICNKHAVFEMKVSICDAVGSADLVKLSFWGT